ncbi:peptidoglycan DD-metalloendopeptidase family protein [Subsaximicrobium wynnwilliamsii]|uniref:Peptidoglycan DD-metalloendopeptidase family protein n=1 Tax=Subsaximicrobium wynnwilliamsii TaxID=291179 RepID=A0A5C6ZKX2_9FLAO|nr:peptidoglycan DD-metalloendopeptidase family protein [Subsaximicrobium wynnwilliamsii]TXD83917.1 peptidoglycan DD-metalloendopeptidase family protein [Subsaximicrobium wynnwilliamsii]TXD89657.1 peptidoglycan DD-metalloendopeptidase family protein [Subsaximicrobium wynnwilliamsii]TXE01642.1 peptidoglycan DD-metalloendopeptidase family protein [Subsaximicrobium wynnwilliamsii]
MLNNTRLLFIMVCLLASTCIVNAQSPKQQALEAKRLKFKKELAQLNTLLFTDKKKEKSMLSSVEDLNYKVSVRRNLIRVTNDQANLLTREINANQNEISSLRDQLKELKATYAAMVVKSYKSKSEQSKVMFLLSSDNFKQAYKRLQYIKQYANYQKEQGELIKVKTVKLQELNTDLLRQKKDKDQLIVENRTAKAELEIELKQQEKLMASIRKNMSSYASKIKKTQQEIDKIDQEIDRIIKEAIAESNKKAGKSTTSSAFALTPEAKLVAQKFEANKGNLPWPVEKGVVKLGYGTQPSPIDPTVKIKNNGVRIATEKNAKVRAVFKGEVSKIILIKNSNPIVMLRHGNYLTIYKNLSKIYVKQGDIVETNQEIGEVFTDSNGESMLGFGIYKDSNSQNPAYWIYKM